MAETEQTRRKQQVATACGYISLCCSLWIYILLLLAMPRLFPKIPFQIGLNFCLITWGVGFILALIASRASRAWLFAAVLPVFNLLFVMYAMGK